MTFICMANAQFTLNGKVVDDNRKPIDGAEVYLKPIGEYHVTTANGDFSFENLSQGNYILVAFAFEYKVLEEQISISRDSNFDIRLKPLGEELSEVVLTKEREKIFAVRSLRKVEGTAIYAGKKTEVVAVDLLTGNLAANNARQIYSQVVGLNIYDNGDAGLQLNIGGRGLDPNRTANFNTRQNNYDISADVLGYPESYYTPPVEALKEIQVVRGAASLQYGTQFGGLINFKFKTPNPNKNVELISRQTIGSNGLFTSFNSIGGTVGKFSYYNYFNYKEGDGFRPNSSFNARNYHGHFHYQISDKTKISFEATILDYLTQQPGGLTDAQFDEDPTFSNRERNWFDIDWNLAALRLDHRFSNKTDFSLNLFALDASRKALGFRQNRVDIIDDGNERELLVDDFQNWGAEARLLSRYQIGGKDAVFLIGSKYYQAYNQQRQGAGPATADADFRFVDEEFPAFPRKSKYRFPNLNIAVFGENVFNLTDKFSITPGFRFEYIKTSAVGNFTEVFTDLAGNVIETRVNEEDRDLERSFVLLGLGASYKFNKSVELYGNISQNYRSVTFNDLRIINPSQAISEDLEDEEGFTADLGVRGRFRDFFSYDASTFLLYYDNRISRNIVTVNDQNRVINLTDNAGTAVIYGLEVLGNWNLKETFFSSLEDVKFNVFTNIALTDSEYTESDINNVEGKKVEHIPSVNFRSGLNLGYKDFLASFQYTYLSKQFNDPQNSPPFPDATAPGAGIIGELPAYTILDLSLSYSYKKWKLEAGVNNLLDESYFTRRANGYPGPGIIPADSRTFYTTIQVKL
ncbi:TonB-dependent receptor domain-containing protein [Croceitalea rosinachiae]|uniref:TonB-dependent receptor n=1 Tax=Croceitalea rosinachiae TaxID=3075596 RepID=A0ABU3AFA9_9FLAO|nr:TonB-dependent receptor [Croceitalea sp. F388]MDT0608237.1 TonB-dependent receptor [Croceitalea sp. F388]